MRRALRPAILVSCLLILAACSSSGSTVSTFQGPGYRGPVFRNILVIGVADSYNNRAMFERTLVKDIASGSGSATAYYTLVKMDTPIDRPNIEKVVNEGNYDAVLITRVLNSDVDSALKVGTSSAKKVRKDGSAANLFRYDYEELNEPVTLTMEMKVVIASDLFSVETKEKVWSVESSVADQTNVGVLVVDASRIVAARLRRDGLIPK